jgi:undecaprenyl-diphosphatase
LTAPRQHESFLVLNGIILLAGEEIRLRGQQALDCLGIDSALAIGIAQATALLPGLSRSGMAMIGGVVVGLRYADAARFSFLIATPIIFGAALHQIPKLGTAAFSPLAVVCFFVSGVCAYASTSILMRYFAHRDLGALNPLAFYCANSDLSRCGYWCCGARGASHRRRAPTRTKKREAKRTRGHRVAET